MARVMCPHCRKVTAAHGGSCEHCQRPTDGTLLMFAFGRVPAFVCCACSYVNHKKDLVCRECGTDLSKDFRTGHEWGQRYVDSLIDYSIRVPQDCHAELAFYRSMSSRLEAMTWDDLPDDVRDELWRGGINVTDTDRFARGWLIGLLGLWTAIKAKSATDDRSAGATFLSSDTSPGGTLHE